VPPENIGALTGAIKRVIEDQNLANKIAEEGLSPIFPPEVGGPATYTLEVSRRLRERGCQIRVVTFADIKPGVKDIEIIPVRLNYKIFGTISRQVRLFFTTLFASKGMELLYAQDPVVVGLCSLIVGKMVRKPIILRVGGDVSGKVTLPADEQIKTSRIFYNLLIWGRYLRYNFLCEGLFLSK